jgi:hypothetical protein
MAILAVPNPKKSLTIDFAIEDLKKGIPKIPLINKKYKMYKSNEAFNQYSLEAYELLSLGVYIDINLNSVGDKKTEIQIEIRRKVGAFDNSVEVTKANQHLENIIESLSKAVTLSDSEIESLNQPQTIEGKKKMSKGLKIFLIIVVVYAISFVIKTLMGE